MTCQEYRNLMMGYLDEELSQDEREDFERHIASCKDCSEQFDQFRKLKQMTDAVGFAEPEDEIWQRYWSNVYNRIERGIGWAIFSIAVTVLLIYGGLKLVESFLLNPEVELLCKAGVVGLIVGVAVLIVSVARERIFIWKKERYRDVTR